jgi:cytochrome c-type biogenesis protein CcmH/NrfF
MTNSNQTRSASHSRKTVQALLLCFAVVIFSGAGDPATRFTELGHQLMCICGCNQILLECNHVGCPDSDGMRNELAAQVTRGDSDSLVQQAFVQKYGPTVLAAPTTTGFNRTAWIVPFAALFFGFGLVVLVIRGWRNQPSTSPAGGGPRNGSYSGQTGSGLAGPSPTGGPRISSAELDQFRDQAGKETEL